MKRKTLIGSALMFSLLGVMNISAAFAEQTHDQYKQPSASSQNSGNKPASQTQGSSNSEMDHGDMGHGSMDHGEMDHGKMDHDPKATGTEVDSHHDH
ncbi:hypothetical protein [Stutzerimonas kunmingensis]|uniref:hypothetical protein n=1 Tax=Stutzerimonas kunmingensis TaxID=1211807 RepID=UPI0028AFC675|nr:hypothetical protein [Stutzerimonas kunmingensis]